MLRSKGSTNLIGLFFVFVATGCASPSAESGEVVYHAHYAIYSSASELEGESSDIIVGTVESSEVRKINPRIESDSKDPELNPAVGATDPPVEADLVFTVYQIRIEEVAKGSTKIGEVIEVSQLGGEVDGTLYRAEDTVSLTANESYALYLETYDGDSPASLLNQTQAAYAKGADGLFTSVSEDNQISAEVVQELTVSLDR